MHAGRHHARACVRRLQHGGGWSVEREVAQAPIVIPIVQQMVRVDLRIRVLDVPERDVISRDYVSDVPMVRRDHRIRCL